MYLYFYLNNTAEYFHHWIKNNQLGTTPMFLCWISLKCLTTDSITVQWSIHLRKSHYFLVICASQSLCLDCFGQSYVWLTMMVFPHKMRWGSDNSRDEIWLKTTFKTLWSYVKKKFDGVIVDTELKKHEVVSFFGQVTRYHLKLRAKTSGNVTESRWSLMKA